MSESVSGASKFASDMASLVLQGVSFSRAPIFLLLTDRLDHEKLIRDDIDESSAWLRSIIGGGYSVSTGLRKSKSQVLNNVAYIGLVGALRRDNPKPEKIVQGLKKQNDEPVLKQAIMNIVHEAVMPDGQFDDDQSEGLSQLTLLVTLSPVADGKSSHNGIPFASRLARGLAEKLDLRLHEMTSCSGIVVPETNDSWFQEAHFLVNKS